ncbi:MAG: alanine/glycine:cation symporter family protein [Bacteroidales bacterium]
MINLDNLIVHLSEFLWTYILIALLLGTALYFSFRLKFVQLTHLKEMGRLLSETTKKDKEHSVSSFQAFTISLASRVGTGNMAGVAAAIAVGGPGAIFWMWVISIIGAASGFAESTLAQLFKRPGENSFIGGPAYYMQYGLGKRWMGIIFSILITITFGLVFNSVQSNTISLAFEGSFGLSPMITGGILTILTLLVIFGGIHRIAKVSSIIVPVMAIGYILLAMGIVLFNITQLPGVIKLIVSSAFGWEQAVGGGVGIALMQGIRRGLFSNEAGMGSAPNAAATADISHPVKQGLIQSLGVFTDTLIICSCTAFIILFSDAHANSDLNGIVLTQAALTNQIGPMGGLFITIAIFFFAFSSIIGNYYYGETNIQFISKKPSWLLTYRLIVAAMVMGGSLLSLTTVWNLADLSMGLMALINLIAILLLGKYVYRALQDYNQQRKAGIDSPVFKASSMPDIADKLPCWQDEDNND